MTKISWQPCFYTLKGRGGEIKTKRERGGGRNAFSNKVVRRVLKNNTEFEV